METHPAIIHIDEAIIVIDKPAGWPAVFVREGKERTVAAWLLEQIPEQASVGMRPAEAGLVHRLDNDTSGLLLAARMGEAFSSLRRQFEEGAVEKGYRALVLGDPPPEGTIDAPIAHHPRKGKKMVVCESEARAAELKGRAARTAYRVIERFERYSLISVTIATGVRHQIRAHLASIGHPIAGDLLYQNARARARDDLSLTRQFLHASRLSFVHPVSGTPISFSSDLPADLRAALSVLRRVEDPQRQR